MFLKFFGVNEKLCKKKKKIPKFFKSGKHICTNRDRQVGVEWESINVSEIVEVVKSNTKEKKNI
jgi:restriction endonuclease S subunit